MDSSETILRAQKFDQLMREREQEYANESPDARFTAVWNSPAGQMLVGQMHKAEVPDGNTPERFDERVMNDAKISYQHLVERLALEPKWAEKSEPEIKDFAASKHPEGRVWFQTWQHQEDLKRREELAARQKAEAPHLYP